MYYNIISLILSHYIYNFDFFYEFDNKLYDDIFELFKFITENELFINQKEDKNNFIKNIDFNILSLTSDDSISKYLMILMKIFKLFDKDDLNYDLYVDYFSNVLDFVLDIKLSYLNEKYLTLLQRELNGKINQELSKRILNVLLRKINKISKDKEIKIIRGLKDLIIFYRKFDLIKDECLTVIQNMNSELIDDEITLLFLISFFDVKYKNIDKFIDVIPFEKIGFINQKAISFLLHHYINEELQNLSDIIKLYEEKDKSKINEFIINRFIKHISENQTSLTIDDFKLIEKSNITIPVENLIDIRNELNYKLVDAFVIKYINENGLNEKIIENYPYKKNLDTLIQETNDKNEKFFEKGYINSVNNLVNILIEIKKIDNIILKDSEHYTIEDIEIEDTKKEDKIVNENAENLINILTNKIEKEEEEKKEEDKKEEDKVEKKKSKANLDIILYIFSEIFELKEFNSIKEKINENNLEKLNSDLTQNILLFSEYEQFIYKTLLNNNLFSHLAPSTKLLTSFMKSYIIFKEYFNYIINQF